MTEVRAELPEESFEASMQWMRVDNRLLTIRVQAPPGASTFVVTALEECLHDEPLTLTASAVLGSAHTLDEAQETVDRFAARWLAREPGTSVATYVPRPAEVLR